MNFDPFEAQVCDTLNLLGDVGAREVDGAEAEKTILGFELIGEPGVRLEVLGGGLAREGSEADGPGNFAGVHVNQKLVDGPGRIEGGGKYVGVVCQRDSGGHESE